MRLRWAFGISIATAVILPLMLGNFTPMIGFGLFLAFWVFATTAELVYQRLGKSDLPLMGRIKANSRSWWGMVIAHLGIAVCLF